LRSRYGTEVQIRVGPRVGTCFLPVLDDSRHDTADRHVAGASPAARTRTGPARRHSYRAGSPVLHQEEIKHVSSTAKALMIMLARAVPSCPGGHESQK